jgi:hypothetical protein
MRNIILYYYFFVFSSSESFPKDSYVVYIIPDFILLAFLLVFLISYAKIYKKNQFSQERELNLVVAYAFFIAAFIMQSVVNFFILFDFIGNTIYIFLEYQFLVLTILGCIPLVLFYNAFEFKSSDQINFILIIGIILIFWMTVSGFFTPQSKWIMYIPFIITSFFNSVLLKYDKDESEETLETELPSDKPNNFKANSVP